MTNAELIKALCEVANWIVAMSYNSEYAHDELKMSHYEDSIRAAADALEAAEKRIAEQQKQIAQLYILLNNRINEIAELEAQLPKEGEWQWLSSTYDRVPREMRYWCSVCHHEEVVHYERPWKHFCPNCGAKMKGGQE